MNNVLIFTTYYNSVNYGGLLQAYALQKYLVTLGYNVKDVCYKTEYNIIQERKYSTIEKIKMNYYDQNIYEAIRITFKLAKRIILKKKYETEYLHNCGVRNNLLRQFRNSSIAHTQDVYDDTNVQQLKDEADIFIVGSDLVWLLGNSESLPTGYWLTFVHNKKKIAYAASMPMKSLSQNQIKKIESALMDFRAISLRERMGVDLLKKNVSTPCTPQQVLDPVFLLEVKEWDDFSGNSESNIPYIFTYFLGDSKKNRKFAARISKSRNMEIINLAHVSRFCETDIGFGKSITEVSPQDFVRLIKNAEIVITDSFHGAAFSVIFKKEFYVVDRFDGKGNNQLNERIINLLGLIGRRDLYINGKISEMLTQYNYAQNDDKYNYSDLLKVIEHSKSFLKEAFS